MDELKNSTSPTALFAGYMTEEELAEASGKSRRTWREYRQRRVGPPWLSVGKTILYPRDGFFAWLKSIEQTPRQRSGKAA